MTMQVRNNASAAASAATSAATSPATSNDTRRADSHAQGLATPDNATQQDAFGGRKASRPHGISLPSVLRGALGALAVVGGAPALAARQTPTGRHLLQDAVPHVSGLTNSTVPAWMATINENPIAPGISRFAPQGTWVDYTLQPAIPVNYAYTSSMQAPTIEGTIFDLNGTLWESDSAQGGVPDCALGASIIAIESAGWSGTGVAAVPFGIAAGAPAPYFDTHLYAGVGNLQVIHTDDLLPTYTGSGPGWQYLGYQPAPDANGDVPAPGSNRKVLYVPYVEKAFAKFLDANPQYKSNPQASGYAALSALRPDVVLTGLTNRPVNIQSRTDGNWDLQLDYCFDLAVPCVLGTPNYDQFKTLGVGFDPKTNTSNLGDGWTLSYVSPFNEAMQLKASGVYKLSLVPDHAYAVIRGSAKTNLDHVTISNPWGCNPDINTLCNAPQELQIARGWFTQLMQTVFYAHT